MFQLTVYILGQVAPHYQGDSPHVPNIGDRVIVGTTRYTVESRCWEFNDGYPKVFVYLCPPNESY